MILLVHQSAKHGQDEFLELTFSRPHSFNSPHYDVTEVCGLEREKRTYPLIFSPSLRPICTIFDDPFSMIIKTFHHFWCLRAWLSHFSTSFLWLLIVLTILGNFVTISGDFFINWCVQIEECTNFYTFFLWKIPTHTVHTYPCDLHGEYASGFI